MIEKIRQFVAEDELGSITGIIVLEGFILFTLGLGIGLSLALFFT